MRFGYWRDPLFLVCLAGYFVNRWGIKPNFDWRVAHWWFNDLICIPFWVPIMVWGMRRLGLRGDDAPPRGHEVLIPLVMWAAVFEIWLPATETFRGRAVADPVDVFCYVVGALVAAVFWSVWYRGKRGVEVSGVVR